MEPILKKDAGKFMSLTGRAVMAGLTQSLHQKSHSRFEWGT